jgi:hypothetical protein
MNRSIYDLSHSFCLNAALYLQFLELLIDILRDFDPLGCNNMHPCILLATLLISSLYAEDA